MKSTAIYLVDDHKLILDSLTLLFQLMDDVTIIGTSSDSREVVSAVQKEKVDLVITDYDMPYLNGIQLTIEIKKAFPTIKVLMLTVNEDNDTIQQAFNAGVSGYIMKKASRQELHNAVRDVMTGKLYLGQDTMKALFETNTDTKEDSDYRAKLASLTPRELEIITLLVKEMSSTEIAEHLFISPGTVESHRHHIIKKLGVRTTIGVVKFAINAGLV